MSQAPLLPSEHFSPSVSLHSGRPATTSLEVAKFFGKRHTDVLRDVNNFLLTARKHLADAILRPLNIPMNRASRAPCSSCTATALCCW